MSVNSMNQGVSPKYDLFQKQSYYIPSAHAKTVFDRTLGYSAPKLTPHEILDLCAKKKGKYLTQVNIEDYLDQEPEYIALVNFIGPKVGFSMLEKKDKTKESALKLQIFNENTQQGQRKYAAQALLETAELMREFTANMNISYLAIHLPETVGKAEGSITPQNVGKAKRTATSMFDQALRSAGLNNTAFEDGNKVYTRYNNN